MATHQVAIPVNRPSHPQVGGCETLTSDVAVIGMALLRGDLARSLAIPLVAVLLTALVSAYFSPSDRQSQSPVLTAEGQFDADSEVASIFPEATTTFLSHLANDVACSVLYERQQHDATLAATAILLRGPPAA
ncbi:hypothetical protein [Blastopirellula retiformator]|uniref:Uncharacterized protein n=1 Tax=Blastopirellula retiformator TaxID=2527970 RepID=A0A5C5V9I8_9BACT|nr:hypothetical protein [Blastopirellula retiformator]TWT34537.1 hypothetical protein Enr8_19460 [Blastopirellula retiformator]